MPNKLNPEQWANDLAQIGKTWPVEAAEIFYRYVALLGLKGVVYRSPVGDPDYWKMPAPPGYIGGQFRGNWDVVVGINPTQDNPSGVDPSGSSTISKGSAEIGKTKVNTHIWLLNNLPYAVRLEEGWSHQAPGPGGIVDITATEIANATVPNANFRIMKNTS